MRVSERERERQRDRQTDRQTDRDRQRQRQTETETETDRQRQTDRKRPKDTDRKIQNTCTFIQLHLFQASAFDNKDTTLCYQLALACTSLGELVIARKALEQVRKNIPKSYLANYMYTCMTP